MFNLTIGLLWHSSTSGNLGVVALTEANIDIVLSAVEEVGFKARILILGTGVTVPTELTERYSKRGHLIENHSIRLLHRQFGRIIKQCDFVLDIGEGDSFSDIYGFKRFFYFCLSKERVILSGCPLMLSPQTIGPFSSKVARFLAIHVMQQCSMVFARDGISMEYLHQLGLRSNTGEAMDVAFRLPFQKQNKKNNDKIEVGINVSGLLYNGGYSRDNQFGLSFDYAEMIHKLLSELAVQDKIQIHLISHVITKNIVEDDYTICKKLAKEYSNVFVAPQFTSPVEAKSYISTLDFFTGARMHACIAAFSSGVAVIPFAYSRKFNGLFESLDYPHFVDGKKDSLDSAIKTIVTGIEQMETLRTGITNGMIIAQNKLKQYDTALVKLIKACHAK